MDDHKGALIWLDKASQAIARVQTIGEAKQIIDKSAAVKLYAAKQNWGRKEVARIGEIEFRATVRLGELLKEMPKAKGKSGQLAGRDSSGATQRAAPENEPKISDLGITHKQSSQAQKLAALPAEKRERYIADQLGKAHAPVAAGLIRENASAHVSQNAGDNEWYTPKHIIERVQNVMGVIDLDPASTAEANRIVRAAKFYSEEDDGLKHEWAGHVFLNPPYAPKLIKIFIEKLVACIKSRQVCEAVVLVNNATETAWFQAIGQISTAICFPAGRIKFWHPRKESVPLQGQAILYAGDAHARFCLAFDDIGFCVKVCQ